MLSIRDLSKHIADCKDQKISVDEFEDWFCIESRGVHRSEDQQLKNAVGAIEAAFSKYYFQNIDEDALCQELATSIRAFEPEPAVYKLVLGKPGKAAQRAFESGSFSQPFSMGILEVAI